MTVNACSPYVGRKPELNCPLPIKQTLHNVFSPTATESKTNRSEYSRIKPSEHRK